MKPEFTRIDNYGLVMKFFHSLHPDAAEYWKDAKDVELVGNDTVAGKYLVATGDSPSGETWVTARKKFSDEVKAHYNIPDTNTGTVVWSGNMGIDAIKTDSSSGIDEQSPPPPQEKRSATEWMADNAMWIAIVAIIAIVVLWWKFIR